jgi:Restriction endonuclease BglII
MANSLPAPILANYEVHEYRHSLAILQVEYPNEYQDLLDVLQNFTLPKSEIQAAGGKKSKLANQFDQFLYARGWTEHNFHTVLEIDGVRHETPTHKIDCYRNRIALDIEWNNKDPFFDRDLNNFRLLYERGAISVGIIITRCTELQQIFNSLGKGDSYGSSTTHMGKLLPRIEGGGGGGCPLLIFGISTNLYDPNK